MEIPLVNNKQILSDKAQYFSNKQKAPENIYLFLGLSWLLMIAMVDFGLSNKYMSVLVSYPFLQ